MPADLVPQIPLVRRLVDVMQGPMVEQSGFEADDVLATLATRTAAAGGTCVLATSDKDAGIGKDAYGWKAGLAASKAVDDFFWHGNVAYGHLDNTREFGQINSLGQSVEADEDVWSCGVALVYSPTREYDLICETYAEFEKESRTGETEDRMSWYLTPGAKVHMSETTDIGFGVPVGLRGDTYDWGFIAKIMIEM